jgi:hypothetical protein
MPDGTSPCVSINPVAEPCPACGEPRVRRHGRALMTCGKTMCGYEMRARRLRGNVYGNRGGGPRRRAAPTYGAIHVRARRAFVGMPCALADNSCAGRIEMALRVDIPTRLLTTSPEGSPYYPGFNTEDAYRPLCRSHHAREGALRTAAQRSPAVAAGVIHDRLRAEHECVAGSCAVCDLLAQFDAVAEALVEAETAAIEYRAARPPSASLQERDHVDVCERGHLLVEPNLVPSDLRRGGRACLACKRANDRSRTGGPSFDVDAVADRIYAQLMAA